MPRAVRPSDSLSEAPACGTLGRPPPDHGRAEPPRQADQGQAGLLRPARRREDHNLQILHRAADARRRGEMVSINSAQDRTILFDLLPLKTPGYRGFELRLQVLAVPGQAMYATTRRLVLKGADSLVFVANSALDRWDENIQSYREMTQNLLSHHLDPEQMPLVFQYNKRDLPQVLETEALDRALNAPPRRDDPRRRDPRRGRSRVVHGHPRADGAEPLDALRDPRHQPGHARTGVGRGGGGAAVRGEDAAPRRTSRPRAARRRLSGGDGLARPRPGQRPVAARRPCPPLLRGRRVSSRRRTSTRSGRPATPSFAPRPRRGPTSRAVPTRRPTRGRATSSRPTRRPRRSSAPPSTSCARSATPPASASSTSGRR